jgi:hypothetical protein
MAIHAATANPFYFSIPLSPPTLHFSDLRYPASRPDPPSGQGRPEREIVLHFVIFIAMTQKYVNFTTTIYIIDLFIYNYYVCSKWMTVCPTTAAETIKLTN